MKVNPDGSIEFHAPPKDPPSRYVATDNPCLFIPEDESCKHRRRTFFTMPCGKVGCNWHCALLKQNVNHLVCESCEEQRE